MVINEDFSPNISSAFLKHLIYIGIQIIFLFKKSFSPIDYQLPPQSLAIIEKLSPPPNVGA